MAETWRLHDAGSGRLVQGAMANSSQIYAAERTGTVPGGLPLPELLAILRRRRRVIFLVTTVATTVALLVGLQVTKTYTATAQVMIEPRESRIVQAEKVAPGLPAEDNAIVETHIKLIQSRATLARAVENLNLLSDPAFMSSPKARDRSVGGPVGLLAGWLPDWVAGRLPVRWAVAAGIATDATSGRDVLRDRAINGLQDDVKVRQSGQSYVLLISYTSTRPDEAARIANGIADAYIDVQLDEKLSATRRASAWLGDQVKQLRWRVFGSELAIQEFRATNGLIEADHAPFDAHELAVLTNSLIDAQAERSAKEARLQSLRDMRSGGHGLESSAEVLSSPLILSLREREMDLAREEAQLSREFGEQHPRILQLRAEQQRLSDRIGQEIDNVIANLENDLAVARSRERAHLDQVREAKGQSAVTGQAEIQLREMEREVAASRSLYETLLVRLKETEQEQDIVQADARLISPAQLPDAPSSPSPKLFVLVGFTGSLVLGSILALLLEQLDNTLRTERQVEELLGVPSLGLVPKITDTQARQAAARPHARPAAVTLRRGGACAPHAGLPHWRRPAAAHPDPRHLGPARRGQDLARREPRRLRCPARPQDAARRPRLAPPRRGPRIQGRTGGGRPCRARRHGAVRGRGRARRGQRGGPLGGR